MIEARTGPWPAGCPAIGGTARRQATRILPTCRPSRTSPLTVPLQVLQTKCGDDSPTRRPPPARCASAKYSPRACCHAGIDSARWGQGDGPDVAAGRSARRHGCPGDSSVPHAGQALFKACPPATDGNDLPELGVEGRELAGNLPGQVPEPAGFEVDFEIVSRLDVIRDSLAAGQERQAGIDRVAEAAPGNGLDDQPEAVADDAEKNPEYGDSPGRSACRRR